MEEDDDDVVKGEGVVVLDEEGEAVTWGLTITVVVELWAPEKNKLIDPTIPLRVEVKGEQRGESTYSRQFRHRHILARNILLLQRRDSSGTLQHSLGPVLSTFVRFRSMRHRLGQSSSQAGKYFLLGSSYWDG